MAGGNPDGRRCGFCGFHGHSELKLRQHGGAPPGKLDRELWAIIGVDAPVSLGVLPSRLYFGIRVVISVPENLRGDFQKATLAISEEPVGGSPTGAPTGAVLAAGALATKRR